MKICLILPYFGKFDSLFPMWLESCKYNHNIDWIIFTDDKTHYKYPHNVKVLYTDFETFRGKVQSFFDFTISLETPYRLCNFKPAYGELFETYISNYDAWGFCDNDMIFGNIEKNIPKLASDKFKIGKFGHLTILPNDKGARTIYRYKNAYKIAFSIPQPLFFDEISYSKILAKNGYTEYKLKIADLKPRVKHFHILNEDKENNKAQCFVWDKGTLLRYYLDKKKRIKTQEYAYIHFLKRPIRANDNLDFSKPIVIVPNRIYNISLEMITPDFLQKINKRGVFFDYWKNSMKPQNLYERILNRLYRNRLNRNLIDKMNTIINH